MAKAKKGRRNAEVEESDSGKRRKKRRAATAKARKKYLPPIPPWTRGRQDWRAFAGVRVRGTEGVEQEC
ncbi:MAG: hypothetical protein ACYSVY_14325 [Planctomycetota bacterium]|jgi:hypothetical protein